MTHHWDEFSKSLAEPVSRRESLRRFGVVLAGAMLSSLATGTVWAAPKRRAGKTKDPCQTFCNCRNKAQQDACLAACRACNGDIGRLCGSCGSYVCCRQPGSYEYGQCVNGVCRYACYTETAYGDAVYCNGICTFLAYDPNNCGACGNVCGRLTPYCSGGHCWDAACGGRDLNWDRNNCGACGFVCPEGAGCAFGICGTPGGGGSGY